ncbi:hypothetical protein MLD38_004386 [Melastoma candidum]|uniref:Uncharacterized protein n=1 Tax=Melastoma candidum TaxID=119954 RepID=A0ACB9S5J9_9MYRT|nr:hypothetical protein MLD38_004386 [Melastoma candidum]
MMMPDPPSVHSVTYCDAHHIGLHGLESDGPANPRCELPWRFMPRREGHYIKPVADWLVWNLGMALRRPLKLMTERTDWIKKKVVPIGVHLTHVQVQERKLSLG